VSLEQHCCHLLKGQAGNKIQENLCFKKISLSRPIKIGDRVILGRKPYFGSVPEIPGRVVNFGVCPGNSGTSSYFLGLSRKFRDNSSPYTTVYIELNGLVFTCYITFVNLYANSEAFAGIDFKKIGMTLKYVGWAQQILQLF